MALSGGCTPCTGRIVIQDHLGAAIANGTKITLIGRPRARWTTIVMRGEVRATRFPPRVERVIGVFRSVVRKGLIVRQTDDYDRKDPETAALLAIIEQTTTVPTGWGTDGPRGGRSRLTATMRALVRPLLEPRCNPPT